MSIESAILGVLSTKKATGYELKKIFEDSSFLHWSGNNNQIYTALVRLKEAGFVTSESVLQEYAPKKKVYAITREGLLELEKFVLSAPGAPECKKQFLVQLAWSDILSGPELDALAAAYENEIGLHLAMEKEKGVRRKNAPDRTKREALLWDMITKNITGSLQAELDWVRDLRRKLQKNSITGE